ncbi:MAG: hypothetical protein ACYC63_04650 [Armatimonadota bacterium]
MKLQLSPRDVRRYCGVDTLDLMTKTPGFVHVDEPYGQYAFKDNGASILAVAHCDTVQTAKYKVPKSTRGPVVSHMALDDRLGVYLLLDVLPRLGVKMDVLLTDDEEMGRSTARLFDPPKDKEYNWIFSFDRAGTDVVMYEFEDRDADWEGFWKGHGLKLGGGAFSDICELEALGCKAFNFGCGYHKQHTPECYADLRETAKMVNRFMGFYKAHGESHFPHLYRPERKWDHWGSRGLDGDWCGICGEYVQDPLQWGTFDVCSDCYLNMMAEYDMDPTDLNPEATDAEIDLAWEAIDLMEYEDMDARQQLVTAVHVMPELR